MGSVGQCGRARVYAVGVGYGCRAELGYGKGCGCGSGLWGVGLGWSRVLCKYCVHSKKGSMNIIPKVV